MERLHNDDYDALAIFRYLLRKFLRFSKEFLRAYAGLNPEQYEALLVINARGANGRVTISQLSERLQIKHHSAINLVNRLVERKLIWRQAGQRDRRERHLELTPKGETLFKELAAVHHRELRNRSEEMIKALQGLRE